MKTAFTSLTVILVILFSVPRAYAQKGGPTINPVGIGFRISPDGAGVTAKVFLGHHWALEGQVNGSEGSDNWPGDNTKDGPGWAIVGLAEYHLILPDPSWRIYFGPGMHFGKWDRYDHRLYENRPLPQGIWGIDGIFGLEYLFKSIPIGLSADIKPAMNYVHDAAFYPNNFFGVSARYYFGPKMVVVRETRREARYQ